ncbi:hypothetical protein [Pseudomonas rubra]|uniref:Uncharacterized protein n=1 Tax=Pseudomonas rubra TaxID=2942627 RepID=A0ABT5P9C8_9PSED|nr:hypothetical protein [Pseudomonas rubra]MDD1014658.1 hypothetical protein [Pseudomonas rubra]MDD1041389.1 hypothetical protein [Pseudomonas rubra]MDD1155786.1 hypothetical protein [Pseudomonas rubra]
MKGSSAWTLMVGSVIGLCTLIGLAFFKEHKVVLAELQFQGGAHLRHDATQLHEVYQQAVQQVLASQQLDTQRLQVELDPQRSDTVLLRGSEAALSPAQRQGLGSQLDTVLKARQSVVTSLQLELDYSQARRLNAAGREMGPAPASITALGRQVLPLQFDFSPEVALDTLVSDSERRYAFAGNRTISGEVMCQVNAAITARMPFMITRFEVDGAQLVGDMDILTHDQVALRLPASVYFDDRDLRVRLEAGGPRVSLKSQSSYGKVRSSWLTFEFGSLGEHPYQPFDIADAGRNGLREMCGNVAHQAGRPFSFFYGSGFDRLEAVLIEPQR